VNAAGTIVRTSGVSVAVESIEGLTIALREAGPAAAWISRARFAPERPYGRRVLWVKGDLELMIAGWTRGPGIAVSRCTKAPWYPTSTSDSIQAC